MSTTLRNTTPRVNYTHHAHAEFNKEHATEKTAQATLAATVALTKVPAVDVSQLALESTQDTIRANIANTLPLMTFVPNGGVANNSLKTMTTNLTDLAAIPLNTTPTPKTIIAYDDYHMTATNNDTRWRQDKYFADAWAFKNDTNQTGGNVYFFSNTSSQSPFTYGDVQTFFFTSTNVGASSVNDIPYFACFSRPTSSGDGVPGFYHSRWVFQASSTAYRGSGARCLYYFGTDPTTLHPELVHVPLELKTNAPTGPRGTEETLYLMSINSDSNRPASAVDYLLHSAGFVLTAGKGTNTREYQFVNSLEQNVQDAVLGLDVLNLLSFTTQNTNSCLNVAVAAPSMVEAHWTGANFNTLAQGGVSNSINLAATSSQTIFGTATVSSTGGMGMGGSLVLQYSADNTNWVSSTNSFYVSAGVSNFSFSSSLALCVKYVRLLVRDADFSEVSVYLLGK